MLNYFGNNNLVPNGYVYTSHTGSKYVFLEGLWFDNSNNKMIDPSKYTNMYLSAQKQIVEHNSSSDMKIGQVYICEGKELTFIGAGKFTHNGNVIAESVSIMEDSQPNGAPNGFVYTSGKGKQYYKKGGEWYISGSKSKVNSSAARPLEQAAIKKIADLNASSDLKIGESTWTSGKGKEYTYVGDDRFISADGKMLPKSMAAKVRDELTAKKDDHAEENSEIKDKVDADIDNTSTATPEDRKEEEKQDQEQAIDDHDAKEDEHGEGEDKIKSIADKIKATDPKTARKITVLLTRADKLSLMAADIMLSGEVDKVKQILQTLNNRDE